MSNKYVSVILPFALPKTYTYAVPERFSDIIKPGIRVEVELKSKIYSGIILDIHESINTKIEPKNIIDIIDNEPIIGENQLKLWAWMASYYCCTLGEVMDAGLPSGLKLSSESLIMLNENYDIDNTEDLNDKEYILTEALTFQKELKIEKVKDILHKKSIYPILKSLLDKNVINIKEELIEKYKPSKIKMVRLAEEYKNDEKLNQALSSSRNRDKLEEVIQTIIEINQGTDWIPLSDIKHQYSPSIFKTLEKKGIIDIELKVVSRLNNSHSENKDLPPLSEEQQDALASIYDAFNNKQVVLLHGVTGSGKTRIYQELIHEALRKGKQVLYLLPEIALTSQIIDRLYESFGNEILLYHSKMSDSQRVEIWKEVLKGRKVVLAARSGIFLPFTNLDLIIVDEEHDPSYKQDSPNPHYHARDTAVYLSKLLDCNIILGSATPSIESYFNTKHVNYRLINLDKRYGESILPDIELIDLGYERKTGRYKPVLSVPLQKAIRTCLDQNQQVILFQNRRGYAPIMQCQNCGWTAVCMNCDVNLTFHKFQNELRCHYCNYKMKLPQKCPSCNSIEIGERGLGTEKIEAVVQQYFPQAKIVRLDFDAAKTKKALDKIVTAFANHEYDIMVGTQMVTKGFNFDYVTLVGIIDGDASLRMPDFRANERTFQLFTQVAGRAGRKKDKGKMMIQTYSTDHPVIDEVKSHNYLKFFERESAERKRFLFPPYVRMIQIEFKHKDLNKTLITAEKFANILKVHLKNRVIGPIAPSIERVKNQYIRIINIKLERDQKIIEAAKNLIMQTKENINLDKQSNNVRINIIVDI